ncbi:transposase family protein [uncultured Sulfitobacter sp.]|uniref:transposase family protein n=1 Tax=Sulfitobacter sp. SH22 TaxID=3421172 RepID=UPI0025E33E58|nr:transposase family protein [uncultured Sulfitobacter sp.]
MGGCFHRVLIVMHIFLSAFDEVPDPRARNVRYDLGELLVIAFVLVLCGSTSRAEMAAFGRAKESFFKNFLKLKHAIPSHECLLGGLPDHQPSRRIPTNRANAAAPIIGSSS